MYASYLMPGSPQSLNCRTVSTLVFVSFQVPIVQMIIGSFENLNSLIMRYIYLLTDMNILNKY